MYRDPVNIVTTYRAQYICILLFCESYTDIALPAAHLFSVTGLTLGMFCAIHFFNQLPWSTYAIFPVFGLITGAFISIAFRYAPGFNDASATLRSDLTYRLISFPSTSRDGNSSRRRKELRAAIKSFRDMKVKNGLGFNYEWSTITNSLQLAADYTFTLLIAFK